MGIVVVFALGLVALLSTGDNKGHPPSQVYAPFTTTTTTYDGGLHALSAAAATSDQTTVVPNVVGTTQRSNDWLHSIVTAGLDFKLSSEHVGGDCTNWSVVSQTPAAGSMVPIGSIVVLTVREC